MRFAHGWPITIAAVACMLATPLPAAPKRVVSGFLCTDEYVFRLLPRDHIAALSFLSADRHPVVSTIADRVKGIPLVHASAEEILARRPDAVVLYAGTEPRLHAQLASAGVPVIDVEWASSLADIRRITLKLGHALGEDGRAHSLVEAMDAKLLVSVAQRSPVSTLIYEPNGYATSDRVTDEILAAAGLEDVAARSGATRSGTIPVEAVVASPPQLLLFNASDASRPSLAGLVLRHPALDALAARVKIAHVSLTPLLCPGPWSVDVLPQLESLGREARALAPPKPAP